MNERRRSLLTTKFVDMPVAEHARWAVVFMVSAMVGSLCLMAVSDPETAWAAALTGLGAALGIVLRLYVRLRGTPPRM